MIWLKKGQTEERRRAYQQDRRYKSILRLTGVNVISYKD